MLLSLSYLIPTSYRTPFSVSILVKLSVICLPPYGSLVVPASIIQPVFQVIINKSVILQTDQPCLSVGQKRRKSVNGKRFYLPLLEKCRYDSQYPLKNRKKKFKRPFSQFYIVTPEL